MCQTFLNLILSMSSFAQEGLCWWFKTTNINAAAEFSIQTAALSDLSETLS